MSENVGHKVDNAITERKRRFQSQKRVYRAKILIYERRRVHIAKTRQPGQNWTLVKGITLLPTKTSIAKAKTRLPSEIFACKAWNAYTERKRPPIYATAYVCEYRAKTHLSTEKGARKGENAFTERKCRSQRRKCFYRVKTSLSKAKTLLPSETVTSKGGYRAKTVSLKAIAGLPSEDVASKGENAFVERKRSIKRRNRVYGAKMSLAKAFTERNRGSLS